MKLLIVEDDPNLRSLWRQVFVDRGYAVREAESATRARTALLAEKADLVILDLYLGHETGLSVAALASYANPECHVVVVTGSSAFAYGELFEMSPVIASVLRKPVDIEHLVAVCEHLTRGQAMPDGIEATLSPRATQAR